MPSVTLNSLTLFFGDRQILENINFSIKKGSRIALTGANGSGKSTLLKIIANLIKPDSGSISVEKNTRVSYLPQSGVAFSDTILIEEIEKAYDEILPMIAELDLLQKRLGSVTQSSVETERLVEMHHIMQERITESDYYNRKAAISRVLMGLGFSEKDFTSRVNTFSGGWQMRIALAKVLLEQPDILLLDEPTNYLDLEARNWLEGFLIDFHGGFVIVSHDRFFLDMTVGHVAEIYQRKVSLFKGNYTQYEEKRALEMESIIKAYERQQEEIEKIEFFIRKFRYNSSKAKLVQSRIKFLEKLEILEKPPGWRNIHFGFPPAPHSGQVALTIENLYKSYGDKVIFKDVNFNLMCKEKLVLVGPNGAGKSTLMGMIAGKTSIDSGTLKLGREVNIGYFCQDDIDGYKSDKTVLEELEQDCPTDLMQRLRSLLGAFLFSGDDVHKPFSVLSGGERNRIFLLKLLLHPANLLLLDEPTNHLDMTSKDILLDALKSYDGTLIFVSHDRYFIEKLATKVLEVDGKNQNIILYPDDYAYYLWKKEQQAQVEEQKAALSPAVEKVNVNKINRDEEKRKKNYLSKLEKEEKTILEQIEAVEKDHTRLELEMAKEENYTDGEKIKKIKEKISLNRKENELLLSNWEQVVAQIDELKIELTN